MKINFALIGIFASTVIIFFKYSILYPISFFCVLNFQFLNLLRLLQIVFIHSSAIDPVENVTGHLLDDYSLLSIVDHLEFDEMLNFASTSYGFRQLITEHYMIPIYRVHEKVLNIEGGNIKTEIAENSINITKFQSILQLPRNFGHLIKNTTLMSRAIPFKESIEINSYIGKYGSSIDSM